MSKDIVTLKTWRYPNFGDFVTRELIGLISGKDIEIRLGKEILLKTNYLTVGSIIHFCDNHSVVWGAGVLDEKTNFDQGYKPKKVLAVRGPKSREHLLKFGIKCPEIYGDPVLLFPKYYNPKIEKRYKLGIVYHWSHCWDTGLETINIGDEILLIDPDVTKCNMDPYIFIDKILSCEKIASSALHGLVVADAYGIPALRFIMPGDEKMDFKFQDYFLSVNRELVPPIKVHDFYEAIEILPNQKYPQPPKIDTAKLWEACPFKRNEQPKYSIVIPTCGVDIFYNCIESIIKYTTLSDKEIIIVINDSKCDEIEARIPKIEQIRVIKFPKRIGADKAANAGLKEAKGDFIIYLNDDIVLTEQTRDDWILILKRPFLTDEMVGMTGPFKNDFRGRRNFLITFCAMLRRAVLLKLDPPGFDEIYNEGGEDDVDLSWRIEEAGYKVVQVPETFGHFPIYHKAEATVHTLPNWSASFERNGQMIIDKWFPRVMVGIPTKDRYDQLAMLLWGLLQQTYKDFDLIIVDDSEDRKDIRELPVFKHILNRLQNEGHKWEVIFGQKKGPHYCHQMVLEKTTNPLVYRIDDDEIPDEKCLEVLVRTIQKDKNIAAVGGLVIDPST